LEGFGHFALEAGGGFEAEEVVGFVMQGLALDFVEFAFGVAVLEFECFGLGGGVAVLLEGEDGAAEPGQRIGDADVLVGIGLAVGAGGEFAEVAEEFASAGGGELEAGFGELCRVLDYAELFAHFLQKLSKLSLFVSFYSA
jgi:hypothetical protein